MRAHSAVAPLPTMMQRPQPDLRPGMPILRSLLIALLLAVIAGPAAAITMKEAIEQVQRETGGKVLAADTIRTRGTVIYRIKVLMPDGRVRIFQIPA